MLQSCFQRAYLGFVAAFLTLFLLFFLCPVLSLRKKFQRSISRATCLFCLSLSAMKNALTKKEKKKRGTQQSDRQKKLEKKHDQIISGKGREITLQPRVLAAKLCENESWPKRVRKSPSEHSFRPNIFGGPRNVCTETYEKGFRHSYTF